MRISVGGFGKFADTLHIGLLKHVGWEAFRNVLSIGGVTYFYAEGCTIGVRYNGAVDPTDVAAQALIVAAAFCDTPLDEVEVVVKEYTPGEVNESEVAAKVQSRMLTMPAPAEVSLHQVEMRGSGPAYWLK